MLLTYQIWLCKFQQCKCVVLLVEEATQVATNPTYFFRVCFICDFHNSQLFQFLLLLFWLGNKEDTLKQKQQQQQQSTIPKHHQVATCFKIFLVIETRKLEACILELILYLHLYLDLKVIFESERREGRIGYEVLKAKLTSNICLVIVFFMLFQLCSLINFFIVHKNQF